MLRTLSLVTGTNRILSLTLLLIAVRLSAQQVVPVTAKLDPSFGDSGVEFIAFPNAPCFTVNCAIPDAAGRTLIAARVSCLSSVVMRYTANGRPDSTFGTTGVSDSLPIDPNAIVWSLVTDSSAGIIGGFSWFNDNTSFSIFGLFRLNGNGSMDTSFGNHGIALSPYNDSAVSDISVMVLSNGSIIEQAGFFSYYPFQPPPDYMGYYDIVAFNANGTLDTAFADSGVYSHLQGGILMQRGDKILDCSTSGCTRFNANGSPDGGASWSPDPAFGAIASAVTPDGSFMVAGNWSACDFSHGGCYNLSALARYDSLGVEDRSFSNFSYSFAASTFGGRSATVASIYLQPDGKTVMTSALDSAKEPNPGGQTIGLARFNINGTLDTSFGLDVEFQLPPLCTTCRESDYPLTCFPQGHNKVVVAGVNAGSDSANNARGILLLRYSLPYDSIIPASNTTNQYNLYVYPNPVTGPATVSYYLDDSYWATIQLFDISGRLVSTIFDTEYQLPGWRQYTFTLPPGIAPGVYVLSLNLDLMRANLKLVIF